MPTMTKAPQGPRWPQASVTPVTSHQPCEAGRAGEEEGLGVHWVRCLARQRTESRGCDDTESAGSLHKVGLEAPVGRDVIQPQADQVAVGASSQCIQGTHSLTYRTEVALPCCYSDRHLTLDNKSWQLSFNKTHRSLVREENIDLRVGQGGPCHEATGGTSPGQAQGHFSLNQAGSCDSPTAEQAGRSAVPL